MNISKIFAAKRTLRGGLLAFVVAGAACGQARAYDVNKDVFNIGPTAYDLHVLLSGSVGILDHYDGYPAAHFGSFNWGPAGPNTELSWLNMGGTNGPIQPLDKVHIGWSTDTHNSRVLDMWWTDALGNRIAGSEVYNSLTEMHYETSGQHVYFAWENSVSPATNFGVAMPLIITNIYYLVSSNLVPLAQLNLQNTVLASQLVPLPNVSRLMLDPGEAVLLGLPESVDTNQNVVLRYEVVGPSPGGSSSVDFIQAAVAQAPPPPFYEVNKDLVNLGPPAHDLHVILSGTAIVTDHFDGYADAYFGSFNWRPDGPNTELNWSGFYGNGGDTLDTGQTVHVGWTLGVYDSQILDMWFTDPLGNRLTNSAISNLTPETHYESGSGRIRVLWENAFLPATNFSLTQPIIISNVFYRIDTNFVPLDQLNRQNTNLAAQLQPVPGGQPIVVQPGQTAVLDLPITTFINGNLVLRFEVFSPSNDAAGTLDFVQAQLNSAPPLAFIGVNKDLVNLGPPAHDLHVLLSGRATILGHFDGYPQGHFSSFQWGSDGPDTQLNWSDFVGSNGNAIGTGEIVHVGWTGAPQNARILDMWFTDGSGQRITNSVVYNLLSRIYYEPGTGGIDLIWENAFRPDSGFGVTQPITVSNLQYLLASNLFPLAQLNPSNTALSGQLRPLFGGTNFTIYPRTAVTLKWPDADTNQNLVLRYETFAPSNNAAIALDFLQAELPFIPIRRPVLHILLDRANAEVIVTWCPTNEPGWILSRTTNLLESGSFLPIAGAVSPYTTNLGTSEMYFRLSLLP